MAEKPLLGKRLAISIRGQVQGVGFRPTVSRVTNQLHLSGWIKNSAEGVEIEVQGARVSEFINSLMQQLPPLAKIEQIKTQCLPEKTKETGFVIQSSDKNTQYCRIAPDSAICQDCLRELFDPESRYYLYPFINCTQCGPRLSISRALPYDRETTSMQAFERCSACQHDYDSLSSRRYHAQPIACANCGPALSHDLKTIIKQLREGKILAVKGLGGYQLICDALSQNTLQRLRQRKKRQEKPFALLALNTESIHNLVEMSQEEKTWLNHLSRPIVLLNKKGQPPLADSVAPGLANLGIMLPSSALHYLLFYEWLGRPQDPLWYTLACQQYFILTSANDSDAAIIYQDDKAKNLLTGIADDIISYPRDIISGLDDSILRIIDKKPCIIRRARGFLPQPIVLAKPVPNTLALGGELKNTFCISRGNEAFLSQHQGDLSTKETIQFFHENLHYWLKYLNVKIERIACDKHPDFYSSRLAESMDLPCYRIQHHHAHLAAVAAEYHIQTPALGLALDGFGYGDDHSAWGGELLRLEGSQYERIGHFKPLKMPGGDLAAQSPWRMGLSLLDALGENHRARDFWPDNPKLEDLNRLLDTDYPFAKTSSCGRLFDAAAALSGLIYESSYEAQAAMMLEARAFDRDYPDNPELMNEGNIFNPLPMFKTLLETEIAQRPSLFHAGLIAGLSHWLLHWLRKTDIKILLLSGGCFFNARLAEGIKQQLQCCNIQVYLPQQVPPNDGGLSLGQLWVAANTN